MTHPPSPPGPQRPDSQPPASYPAADAGGPFPAELPASHDPWAYPGQGSIPWDDTTDYTHRPPRPSAAPKSYVPPAAAAPLPGSRTQRRPSTRLIVTGLVLAALTGGAAATGTDTLLKAQNAPAAAGTVRTAQTIVNNTDSVNAVSAAAQKATPSVVTIAVTSGTTGGTGAGIILDSQGDILTNTHVVTLDGKAPNPAIEVRTSDGKVYAGTVVGTDPLSDLAVIKVNAPNLVPAALGDSSKVNVGDTAIAIGAPLGLTGTVTEGIISTLNRTISVASSAIPNKPGNDSGQASSGDGFSFAPPDRSQSSTPTTKGNISLNVIQTDAAINPGNSGGALVNTQGEIIGVNVAIASAGGSSSSGTSAGNIGVGFAIPINTATRIAQEITTHGSATHGQLGVTIAPKAAGKRSRFSIGAAVADVAAGSAAEKAGIQKGDVLTALGNRAIQDASDLTAAVHEQPAGATLDATLTRGGKQQQITVTLESSTNQP